MTAFIPIRIARVRTTGQRFVLVGPCDGFKKVRTRGPVIRRVGLSAVYGPDKKFLASAVSCSDVDLTEGLLDELIAERSRWETFMNDGVPPPPPDSDERFTENGLFERDDRRRWRLTDKGWDHFVLCGRDTAADRCCDVEHMPPGPERERAIGELRGELESMAADAAAYDEDVPGPSGYGPTIRDAVADAYFEGMSKEAERRGFKI